MDRTQRPRGTKTPSKHQPSKEASRQRLASPSEPTTEPRGPRTVVVGVRLRPDESAYYEQAANDRGLGIGPWLRMLGANEIKRLGRAWFRAEQKRKAR